jgi:hypothetical protein
MSMVAYKPREWIELMVPAAELSKQIANTEFVPKGIRGNPAAIAAAILYGDEVGLGPMQSLAKIAVIDGRPTLSSEAQRALILAAGHEIWVEEATNSRVTVAGRRHGSDETSRVTWTLDDARRAKLEGRPAWRLYPRQMLTARASAELARAVFADVIGGLAATEELEESPELGEGATEQPAVTRRKRERAPSERATVKATPVEPVKAAEPEEPPLPGEELAGSNFLILAAREQASAVVPPDPPPAAGAAPQELDVFGPEAPMSDAQRRKMHALLRSRRVETREARLAYVSHVLDRDIESSADLTIGEASRVIDALEQWDPDDPDSQPFPDHTH